MALGIGEEISMPIFDKLFLLLTIELRPDGDIEGAVDFHHHLESELASRPGAPYLLVGELLG